MAHRTDENALLLIIHIADGLVYDSVIELFVAFQSGAPFFGETDANDSSVCIIPDTDYKSFFSSLLIAMESVLTLISRS